jgi:hypothetical protein
MFVLESLFRFGEALFTPRRCINGMIHFRRLLVLLPNFNGLVRFSRNQSRSRQIKLRCHDAVFRLQTARLHCGPRRLKVVSRRVIPKVHRPVVSARHEDAVVVDRERVDDGRVPRHALQEASVPGLPLLQTVRRARHERAFEGRFSDGADAFLVLRQRRDALASHQIPQFHGRIVRSGNDGGMRRLRLHRRDGVIVSRQTVHLFLGAHVPYARDSVATARDEQIQLRVQRQTEYARQVAVVVPNDLVRFQIPALDLLVLARRKEVRVAVGKGEAANGRHVPRQRHLQRVVGTGAGLGQVPYFDRAVGTAGGKHGVGRVHGNGADPTEVGRQDCGQFPGSVPSGSGNRGVWRVLGIASRSFHENGVVIVVVVVAIVVVDSRLLVIRGASEDTSCTGTGTAIIIGRRCSLVALRCCGGTNCHQGLTRLLLLLRMSTATFIIASTIVRISNPSSSPPLH